MTIGEMHYDFKIKINKVDSEQNRNLLVPEIDWTLREAERIFIENIANPRQKSYTGFELNQRTRDDIRTIVVNNDDSSIYQTVTNNISSLPSDYRHFIRGYVNISKGNCTDKKARVFIRQHDDEFEESPFDRSSFEWRTVNGVFFENGVKFYTDETFTIDKFFVSYIREPRLMHNAAKYRGGTYNLPSGQVLTGSVDCELPKHVHGEIVDIAVLIATGQLQIPDYEVKMAKVRMNNNI